MVALTNENVKLLKAGDKLRCIDPDISLIKDYIYEFNFINHDVEYSPTNFIHVVGSNGGYFPWRFEKVEETHELHKMTEEEFKSLQVGDIVVNLTVISGSPPIVKGGEYTVKRIWGSHIYIYDESINNVNGWLYDNFALKSKKKEEVTMENHFKEPVFTKVYSVFSVSKKYDKANSYLNWTRLHFPPDSKGRTGYSYGSTTSTDLEKAKNLAAAHSTKNKCRCVVTVDYKINSVQDQIVYDCNSRPVVKLDSEVQAAVDFAKTEAFTRGKEASIRYLSVCPFENEILRKAWHDGYNSR